VFWKDIEVKKDKINYTKKEKLKFATLKVGIMLALAGLLMSCLTLWTGKIENVSTFLVGSSLGWLIGWVLLFVGEETGI
jgi:polyferredoxin